MAETLVDGRSAADPGGHDLEIGNLVQALIRAKALDRFGLGFVQSDLSVRELTWREIAIEAELRGGRLRGMGLHKGQRVALFAHDEEAFAVTFFGAVLAGLVPVPLAPPALTAGIQLQQQRIAGIVSRSGAACIVGPEDLAPVLESVSKLCPSLQSWATYEELARRGAGTEAVPNPANPSPDDLCLLQFTSGSTSEPKGVEVTHGNVVGNAKALHELLQTNIAQRRGVTWVPLFHDMGLIGSLIPSALFHSRHVFLPALTFVRRPQSWLELVDRYRATITTANNFALRAAMKALAATAPLDLSCLQVVVVGGEPIRGELAKSFIDAFRPHGLSESALSPAYGMAEATLAMSIKAPQDRFRDIQISREDYEVRQEVRLAARGEARLSVVDCGTPLPGHKLAVVNESFEFLPEGRVGEIVLQGPSVCRGYYDDPESTRSLFQHGWMRTGDLGFVREGHVFVSGRLKDLIIIGGRNYYPQDIEWAVSQLAGVRSHHVIGFSVPGPEEERLVILAEGRKGQDYEAVRRAIRELVAREFGVRAYNIVVTKPGVLPQTSSGKPRRRQARDDYLRGLIASTV